MWRDFYDFCEEHGGPVQVRAAARAAGLAPRQVHRRARAEGWWHPYADVVAPPGVAPTPVTWARAALAHARGHDLVEPHPVALTRWSAAAAYGVHRTWPTAVQVAVDAQRRLEAGARFRPHRLCGLGPGDIRPVPDHGLAVLAPTRLLRELAVVADVRRLTTLVIDLVQQRHLTLDAIREMLDEQASFRGRARLRAVAARLDDAGRTDSIRELDARSRLMEAGIPLDRGQVAVRCLDGVAIHFDLGIAAIGLGIDLDSMLAHATRAQLRKDVRRGNRVALLPEAWRVIRMTVEDLDADWPDFIELVRAMVVEQSRRWLGRDWP